MQYDILLSHNLISGFHLIENYMMQFVQTHYLTVKEMAEIYFKHKHLVYYESEMRNYIVHICHVLY